MFISCGAQRCLYSCWGFLPHLVITRSSALFLCFCFVQMESKTWFEEVASERDSCPSRGTCMTSYHMRGVCTFEVWPTILIMVNLWHKLHCNFAISGMIMSGLRVHSSTFTGKIAAYLANQKIRTMLQSWLRGAVRGARCPHIFTSTHSCVYSLQSQECFCSALKPTLQNSK